MKQFTLPRRSVVGPVDRIANEPHPRTRWAPGRAKVGLLLWLLGVPLPIVILIVLFRSCTG